MYKYFNCFIILLFLMVPGMGNAIEGWELSLKNEKYEKVFKSYIKERQIIHEEDMRKLKEAIVDMRQWLPDETSSKIRDSLVAERLGWDAKKITSLVAMESVYKVFTHMLQHDEFLDKHPGYKKPRHSYHNYGYPVDLEPVAMRLKNGHSYLVSKFKSLGNKKHKLYEDQVTAGIIAFMITLRMEVYGEFTFWRKHVSLYPFHQISHDWKDDTIQIIIMMEPDMDGKSTEILYALHKVAIHYPRGWGNFR